MDDKLARRNAAADAIVERLDTDSVYASLEADERVPPIVRRAEFQSPTYSMGRQKGVTEQMTSIEEMVRNVLSQAIADGLVQPASKSVLDDPDPQNMTTGDLCGTANVLSRDLASQSGELREQILVKLARGIDDMGTAIPDYGSGEELWLALLRAILDGGDVLEVKRKWRAEKGYK